MPSLKIFFWLIPIQNQTCWASVQFKNKWSMVFVCWQNWHLGFLPTLFSEGHLLWEFCFFSTNQMNILTLGVIGSSHHINGLFFVIPLKLSTLYRYLSVIEPDRSHLQAILSCWWVKETLLIIFSTSAQSELSVPKRFLLNLITLPCVNITSDIRTSLQVQISNKWG